MTNKIPVFLSSDNNYAPFIATTIASICNNTKSFIEFYILDSGISEGNKEKILSLSNKFDNFSLEYIFIDVQKYFKNFRSIPYITLSTYNRILIPELNKKNEKIIYLDCDLIVTSDISELYNIELSNFPIAMAKDTGKSEEVSKQLKILNINKFYNAGVLFINCEQWRKNNCTQKLLDTEAIYRDKTMFADQAILSIVFQNNCFELSSKFNVQYGSDDIVIRHFVNTYKPWKTNYFMIGNKVVPLNNFDDFWYYAKMTPFYEELLVNYKKNINQNMLTKRMSIIADKIKKEASICKI